MVLFRRPAPLWFFAVASGVGCGSVVHPGLSPCSPLVCAGSENTPPRLRRQRTINVRQRSQRLSNDAPEAKDKLYLTLEEGVITFYAMEAETGEPKGKPEVIALADLRAVIVHDGVLQMLTGEAGRE